MESTMPRLCDAHIHLIPKAIAQQSSFYQGAWVERAPLYAYLDEHGIEKALLTYPSTDADRAFSSQADLCRTYNEYLEEVVRENPKILAAGLVDVENPGRIPSAVRELKEKGIAAVSITSSHAGKFVVREMRPLYEAAEQYDMPVFIHPQTTNPIGCERLQDPLLMPVLQFPFDVSVCLGLLMTSGILTEHKVKFLFPSLGGVLPFLKERLDRVYSMLRKRNMVKDLGDQPSRILRNVYVDTAGSSLATVRLAIDLFGEDNILWGSDYPALGDVRAGLEAMTELGRDTYAKITSANFRRVFRT